MESVMWKPGGKVLASSCTDGMIKLWAIKEQKRFIIFSVIVFYFSKEFMTMLAKSSFQRLILTISSRVERMAGSSFGTYVT